MICLSAAAPRTDLQESQLHVCLFVEHLTLVLPAEAGEQNSVFVSATVSSALPGTCSLTTLHLVSVVFDILGKGNKV